MVMCLQENRLITKNYKKTSADLENYLSSLRLLPKKLHKVFLFFAAKIFSNSCFSELVLYLTILNYM